MTKTAATIGELFDVQLGKMLDAKGNKGEPYPYLGNRNVQWDRCDVSELQLMRFTSTDRERYSLRPGDLLVCEGGEVGRTAIWRGEVEPCFFQKAIHRLRPRKDVEPRFALHYMRWATGAGVFRHLTTATSIAHLTKEKLETAPFPAMPLAEQRRIVGLLDEADALRRKRRESLILLDDLLRATFVDMFGDPVTNARGWATAQLGELLLAIDSGWSPTCEARPALPGEWGVLKLGAVTTGRFIEDHKALPAGVAPQPDLELCSGDLLFTRKNTTDLVAAVAYVHQVRPRLMFPDLVFRLRPDVRRILSAYIAVAMMLPGKRAEIQGLAAGSSGSMPGISKAKLVTVRLPVPPMPEQERFHTWVEQHEVLRARCTAAIGIADAAFSALLSRAFSGEL